MVTVSRERERERELAAQSVERRYRPCVVWEVAGSSPDSTRYFLPVGYVLCTFTRSVKRSSQDQTRYQVIGDG